jgi:hypothetical protein
MFPQSGLKQRLRELAGNSAVNCGHATSQSSLHPADVTDCALQEYASKNGFYARFDLEGGFDTNVVVGFASDGKKVYVITSWRAISWDGDEPPSYRLQVYQCPLPIKLLKTKSGLLDCFSADPGSRPKLLHAE